MPRDHEVHAVEIEQVPDLLHLKMISVHAGAEARMMEVRDRALRARVRREIGREPRLLRHVARARTARVGPDHVRR